MAQNSAVDGAVADERTKLPVANEALSVDHEPVPSPGERGQRLEGEVVAGQCADDDPLGVSDRIAYPPGDVGACPGIGERVDRHDSPIALVVKREPRR